MRIAITVDPYLPVPPTHYGGIERVVDLAVKGLVARGHQVTLFAHPDSRVSVPLVPYGAPPHTGAWNRLTELWQLGSAVAIRRRQFDVVFSWGRLAALLPILPDRRLPKVQRYCRNLVPWRGVQIAVRLAGDSISFAGASTSVYDELPRYGARGGRWHTMYDAIDMTRYDLVRAVPSDAPLVFLGRLERIKGAHAAIAIARQSGRRLVIAGNHATAGPEAAYFQQEIAPHVDGDRITYVGPVDDEAKNRLLGSAAALLFPIDGRSVRHRHGRSDGVRDAGDRVSVRQRAEIVVDGVNGSCARRRGGGGCRVARLDAGPRARARQLR